MAQGLKSKKMLEKLGGSSGLKYLFRMANITGDHWTKTSVQGWLPLYSKA